MRWKSGTAPGTRSLADVSTLTGNSANAEVVAKERVNTVRCLNLLKDLQPYIDSQAGATRAQQFNGGGINFSWYLTDGLVGDGSVPPRLPLKAGDWAFVYWNGGIYLGQGMLTLIYPTHNAHCQLSLSFHVLFQRCWRRESTRLASIYIRNYHFVLLSGSGFRRDHRHTKQVPVYTPQQGQYQGQDVPTHPIIPISLSTSRGGKICR